MCLMKSKMCVCVRSTELKNMEPRLKRKLRVDEGQNKEAQWESQRRPEMENTVLHPACLFP